MRSLSGRSAVGAVTGKGGIGARAVAFLLLMGLASAPERAGAEGEDGYLGDAACMTCHEDLQQHYSATVHAKMLSEANARTERMSRGCEGCHGPGKAHVEARGGKGVGGLVTFRAESPAAIANENAVCLDCHEKGNRRYWSGSAHESRDVACSSCHAVMKNLSPRHQLAKANETQTCSQCHLMQRAQLFRNAHIPLREGNMSCASYHDPHGSPAQAMMLRDSVNDTCYACHADKRGPFLWEHAPVTESCLNCHDPHGSTREHMLKLSLPRLCQQCHVESRHPTEARLPGNKFVISRSCNQCHQSIHGSNHPSGFAFTR